MPYGATSPENLERIADDGNGTRAPRGPMFIFYDQEPIYGEFNYDLFDHIVKTYQGPFVLVTTERDSAALDHIHERYGWPCVYYFHHVFAALDWFRGSRLDVRLVPPDQRLLKKKYISFNRLTSSRRVYRSLLIADLAQRDILDQGHVSYNENCPEADGMPYYTSLNRAAESGLITNTQAQQAIGTISALALPLRIDYQDQAVIPNHSFSLSAVAESQESFCYLVTETCFWESKCHLTEKIFKPIVAKRPFILVGAPGSLAYLKSYGFQTFDRWIDESYDSEPDPVQRMDMIVAEVKKLCHLSPAALDAMYTEMTDVLEYNFNWMYGGFRKVIVDEMVNNFRRCVIQHNAGRNASMMNYIDHSHMDWADIKMRLTY
jgi:hypothetical protein